MNQFVLYASNDSNTSPSPFLFFPLSCDDGHGDYNRSYDKGYDDFDYADYSTGKEDNNFRTQQKKKRKSEKQIIEKRPHISLPRETTAASGKLAVAA